MGSGKALAQALTAKAQQRGLGRLDFQVELREPFGHRLEEGLSVGFPLETGDLVVRIADQVGIARAAHQEPFSTARDQKWPGCAHHRSVGVLFPPPVPSALPCFVFWPPPSEPPVSIPRIARSALTSSSLI